MKALSSSQLLSVFRKHLVIGKFRFSLLSMVTINRQTLYDPGILRQNNESYQVSMVTIKRQTSYDSGILPSRLRKSLRGLPMNHTRFADWVTTWVVHLPEWTETGGHNYRIFPAIRRGFRPSRMTSNNLISPMKFCYKTNSTLPKQCQSSRSV